MTPTYVNKLSITYNIVDIQKRAETVREQRRSWEATRRTNIDIQTVREQGIQT